MSVTDDILDPDNDEGMEDEDATGWDAVRQLVGCGLPHPEYDDLSRLTQFNGYVKVLRTESSSGEMVLTIGVRPRDKLHAFLMAENPGRMLLFDVYNKPTRRQLREARAKKELGMGNGNGAA